MLLLEAGPNFVPNAYPPGAVLLAGFPDPALSGSPDICLILTLRADFYGRALRHRPLADALQGHVENLGPMNRQELQAAIRRPAEIAKVSFEPGLVETLLDDVENKPGSLPLLQFALREMWGRQQNRKITRKSYDDIGGVEGALAQRAETIFTLSRTVRPVWIEVIGAVAHLATIMPCRRQRQNRAALTPKPRRPQAARMPQAQNAR